MAFVYEFSEILFATCRDVLPIIILIVGFQLLVLRQSIPNLRRLVVGGVYVVLGLALFLAGLEKALFPLGKIMAAQLSDPAFIYGAGEIVTSVDWKAYGWVYLFAALIGFATTIAEPSLIAVAYKANEVSAGTIISVSAMIISIMVRQNSTVCTITINWNSIQNKNRCLTATKSLMSSPSITLST